jgi:hypothetical protein
MEDIIALAAGVLGVAAVFIAGAGIPALIVVLGFKRHWRDAAIVGGVVPALCGVIGALAYDPRPMHIFFTGACNLPIGFLIGAAVGYPLFRWRETRRRKEEPISKTQEVTAENKSHENNYPSYR